MMEPVARPASLMLLAALFAKPGKPPRLMMLPWRHSVAADSQNPLPTLVEDPVALRIRFADPRRGLFSYCQLAFTALRW